MTHQTVTVPVEPTAEMIEAGKAAASFYVETYEEGITPIEPVAAIVYRGMIAASPPATAAPEGVGEAALVERIARMIDPLSWEIFDREGAEHAAFIGVVRDSSLEKARAILAALPQETEGWREIESATDYDPDDCQCSQCVNDAVKADGGTPFDSRLIRMFLCPRCGNKRCPHSTWHGYACTRSNALNQVPVPLPSPPVVSEEG